MARVGGVGGGVGEGWGWGVKGIFFNSVGDDALPACWVDLCFRVALARARVRGDQERKE